jgi:GT2 family glycosyltransferase
VAVAFCRVEPGPHDPELGFIPDHLVDRPVLVRSLLSKSRARGIGAGMAVRRDVAVALGGFDQALGPGGPLRSGEDRDLAARALLRGWWLFQTPDAIVIHHGFRTWAEGRSLARRDWYGIGAAYVKQVKCGNLGILPVIAHEVIYFGLAKPLFLLLIGRRRNGLRRIGYFGAGFVRGLQTPVDSATMLYVRDAG